MSKILIIFTPFIKLAKLIYKIIDKIVITPISRLIYKIGEISKDNSGKFERILNRPNVLIYISLLCAIAVFLLVDSQVISFTEREAEIITDQKVSVVYNKEAYVVEGVPETVDITLIGNKSSIYLATQLGEHEVVLDLSKYSAGTYKVKLKYNHSVQSVNYKLDPSTITVKISEKVSETRALGYDLMNENKLDSKLSISNVSLDTSEVVVKSSKEILEKVSVVKALVDASKIDLKESGNFTLEDIPLVAYDQAGNMLKNVEMVPSKVTATVTIDSYHKSIPVKVVTKGEMSNGKAIQNITSSVTDVVVYGEKSIVDNIPYIEATFDINGLDGEKTKSLNLTKPAGVRYMSQTKTNVTVSVGTETQREIANVPVQTINLGEKYSASAATVQDRTITVLVKGVEANLADIDASKVTAFVDLNGLKAGTHTVKVTVEIDDERVKVQPIKTEINVKVVEN